MYRGKRLVNTIWEKKKTLFIVSASTLRWSIFFFLLYKPFFAIKRIIHSYFVSFLCSETELRRITRRYKNKQCNKEPRVAKWTLTRQDGWRSIKFYLQNWCDTSRYNNVCAMCLYVKVIKKYRKNEHNSVIPVYFCYYIASFSFCIILIL